MEDSPRAAEAVDGANVAVAISESVRRTVPIAPGITGEHESALLAQKRALGVGETPAEPAVETDTTGLAIVDTGEQQRKRRKKENGAQPPENLNPEEKAKWKRMLRNRESAARSRDRKRRKNLELEQSIARTNESCEKLERMKNEAITLIEELREAGFIERQDVAGDALVVQPSNSEHLAVGGETDSQPDYLKADTHGIFGNHIPMDATKSAKDHTP